MTFSFFIYKVIDSRQHEWKSNHCFMEVVEEYIIYSEARKGIEQSTDNRIKLIFDISSEKGISSQRCQGKLENKQGCYHIGHKTARKRQSKPEKRTANHIEAVRAYDISSQIGSIAPADITVSHGIMYHLIKRYLLYIEITVEKEISLVP